MNWKQHLTVGLGFGVLLFLIWNYAPFIPKINGPIWMIPVLIAFSSICALVPDLDHDMSKGRQILDYGIVFFSVMVNYLGACNGTICIPSLEILKTIIINSLAFIGAYFIIFRFFKPEHRGITHTIFATVIFGILIYFVIGFDFSIFGMIGYFSHLVADNHIKLI